MQSVQACSAAVHSLQAHTAGTEHAITAHGRLILLCRAKRMQLRLLHWMLGDKFDRWAGIGQWAYSEGETSSGGKCALPSGMDCIEACPEKDLPSLPELCPDSRITKPLCTTAGSFCCRANSLFWLALASAFSDALSSAQQETPGRISDEGTGDEMLVPDRCASRLVTTPCSTKYTQPHAERGKARGRPVCWAVSCCVAP